MFPATRGEDMDANGRGQGARSRIMPHVECSIPLHFPAFRGVRNFPHLQKSPAFSADFSRPRNLVAGRD
jgi:hypothetical protein